MGHQKLMGILLIIMPLGTKNAISSNSTYEDEIRRAQTQNRKPTEQLDGSVYVGTKIEEKQTASDQ